MKKRFKKWWVHLFIRYIPGTSKLASLEALRISSYITNNFDLSQQLIILEEIKDNMISYRNTEILFKLSDIERNQIELKDLKLNLSKLCAK